MYSRAIALLILILFGGTTSYCQAKLVIKPGLSIGYGFNYIQNKLTAEESFTSPKPGFTLVLNGRAEYYLDSSTFLDLTFKGSEAFFSFRFGIDKVFSYIHQTSASMNQFNVGINRFFIKPKIGVGIGLAFNADEDYYQRNFANESYRVVASSVSYSRKYTITPDKSIGVILIGRIGFSFYKDKKNCLT